MVEEGTTWRKAYLSGFAGPGVDDLSGRAAIRAFDLHEAHLGEAEVDRRYAFFSILRNEGTLGQEDARAGDENVVALVVLDRRDERAGKIRRQGTSCDSSHCETSPMIEIAACIADILCSRQRGRGDVWYMLARGGCPLRSKTRCRDRNRKRRRGSRGPWARHRTEAARVR
jgi:hypothetical protein